MGIPGNRQDRYEALYDVCGVAARNTVRAYFPVESTEILDVGACWGKYRDLLPEYEMDACEVWEPYIVAERLDERYRKVWHCDVMDVDLSQYSLVIFGDVLEHLSASEAQVAIKTSPRAVVVVPYEYEQGPEDGNPFETHLQDDLTEGLMRVRYPELTNVFTEWRGKREFKGVWLK
jgi:hypothetical protein